MDFLLGAVRTRFAGPPPIGGFTGRDLDLRSAHP
jgi:hypothetical protein